MPLAPAQPIDRILAPLRSFIHSSVAGGVVLIVAAVAAIAWANSPWASSAWLGGIGFTMSLFVGELAFADPASLDASKTGILAASIVSGVGGYLILFVLGSRLTDRDRAADDAGAQQL